VLDLEARPADLLGELVPLVLGVVAGFVEGLGVAEDELLDVDEAGAGLVEGGERRRRRREAAVVLAEELVDETHVGYLNVCF